MKEMSRPMERYGKSAEGILGASQGFYADNDAYLAEALRQARYTASSPGGSDASSARPRCHCPRLHKARRTLRLVRDMHAPERAA
jgi:hypothetical protein